MPLTDRWFAWIAKLQGKTSEQVCREHHTFWIGCFEMICLRIPPRFSMTDHARTEMKQEEHYYHWGRATGILSWVIILGILL